MDGFHDEDAVLNARGLRARKGAPDTFDVAGLFHLLHRRRIESEVAIPVFDRHLELSRAAGDVVLPTGPLLIVAGNWRLLAAPPWDALPLFDLTMILILPEAALDRRLQARWAYHGKTPEQARHWIDSNDMPNARRVLTGSRPADLTIPG